MPGHPDGVELDLDAMVAAIDERTLLVECSHVLFRTSTLVDVAPLVARAHEVGALVLVDGYQAAGTRAGRRRRARRRPLRRRLGEVPVRRSRATAGCTPRPQVGEALRPVTTGWFGVARPFDFDPELHYAPGIGRFAGGTPGVPAAYAAAPAYEALAEIGMSRVRERSVSLTQPLLEAALERGFTVRSPHDPDRRGGHVTIDPGDSQRGARRAAPARLRRRPPAGRRHPGLAALLQHRRRGVRGAGRDVRHPGGTLTPDEVAPELVEASLTDLADRLRTGATTSVALVEAYLRRVDALDAAGPTLRSVIEVNPDALEIARERDVERAAGRVRGPLHGLPVMVKDNVATADRMQTTAGSLALVGHPPDADATVARQLREAGAVLLAKTNLSEWANFRGTPSSSGWSGRGGLTRNPYVLDRTASGSSSGSAVAAAASLAAVTIGTETDGSILSPAAACGLVGLKPTVGLTSRAGVIPISHSQDTVGPMARTVTDAALTLGALVGVDPRDPATAASAGRSVADYTVFLRADALRGARLGVPREGFWGYDAATDAAGERALDVLRGLGATLVDVAHPGLAAVQAGTAELTVLQHEFKADLAAYLQALPDRPGVPRSLADLIAFNRAHADRELLHFGQETFLAAEATGGLDSPVYLDALAQARRLGRDEGVDALLGEHDLQALVAPTTGPAGLIDLATGERPSGGCTSSVIAVGGYPGVTVPMGFAGDLPLGLCFSGTAWSEPTLLACAYAYEQATLHRAAPRFLPASPV